MATLSIQRRLRKLEGTVRPEDIVIVVEYVEMPPIQDRLPSYPIVVSGGPVVARHDVVSSEV